MKDFVASEDQILLFTTQANIQHLAQASFWMIDGTFRTVPKIFGQLYTIHAPVSRENSRILLLVYSLLTGKSEEIYRCLLKNFLNWQ